MKPFTIICLLFLSFSYLQILPLPALTTTPQFVYSDGSKLLLNNSPIILKGLNYYPRDNPWNYMWSQWDGNKVQSEVGRAAILGSNTLRILIPYGEIYGWNNDKTGVVTPLYLDELRQMVQIAGNFNMRVIITLFDFSEGFPAAGTVEEKANLTYLKTIVSAFAGDDRVLAWDLHNEPDNYQMWKISHQPDLVLDWASRMAATIRQLDPNHLLTVGPGSYENLWYSDSQGRSFIGLSDIVSLHSYNSLDFGNEVYHVREHTTKPILLEETGWPTGPISGDSNFTESSQQRVYDLAISTVKQTSLVGFLGWTLSDFVPVGLIKLDDYQNYYGLVRRNGTLKPAGLSFRQGLQVTGLASTTTSNLPLTQQPVDETLRTVYFPQTDHYVSTPLKELWRRAGGEAIFGLPITDAIVEQLGDDGTDSGYNARIVQYFERARFEYYPGKIHDKDFLKYSNIYKYFYIIDFSQLGRELGGPNVQNSPTVTRQQPDGPNYQFFSATSHDLSGPFLAFWQTHYGYKIFGSPISQPLSENGLQVQYFEQGRLEYHPEFKGQAGEVQVSKLGITAANAKGWLYNQSTELPNGTFVENSFEKTWQRVDQPVVSGAVTRSWLWGPGGFAVALESYTESVGGQRLVQYFDKSRMELTKPADDPLSKWYVTNGLLAKELISGRLQTGDNSFGPLEPAQVAIAGDPTEANLDSPTYASFSKVATLSPGQNIAPDKNGQVVDATLAKNGEVGQQVKPDQLVRYSHYIPETSHNIPDVFWNYLSQSRGPVQEGNSNALVEGDVVDWQFSVGLPLTEAYWVRTRVAGLEQDVLVQAFERRILTYTPANPTQFQVEMGNVGRHYYVWRYLSGHDQ